MKNITVIHRGWLKKQSPFIRAASLIPIQNCKSALKTNQLLRMGAVKKRGEIPNNYKVLENPSLTVEPTPNSFVSVADMGSSSRATDSSVMAIKSIGLDYFLWIVNRFSNRAAHENDCVPGFTAVKSATLSSNFYPTTKIFTPILPYPATTYDAILTTMVNFQDALKQKGDAYGGLWADEGVYSIAKEIQLMKPDQFDNIFLGLGGFHMEKIVLACLGSYLEPSGIFDVLVETKCYGTNVIKSVISGSHYARARTAHSMIHEVFATMMFEAFLSKYPQRRTELEALQVNCQSKELKGEDWNTASKCADVIQAAFECKERASLSKSFDY